MRAATTPRSVPPCLAPSLRKDDGTGESQLIIVARIQHPTFPSLHVYSPPREGVQTPARPRPCLPVNSAGLLSRGILQMLYRNQLLGMSTRATSAKLNTKTAAVNSIPQLFWTVSSMPDFWNWVNGSVYLRHAPVAVGFSLPACLLLVVSLWLSHPVSHTVCLIIVMNSQLFSWLAD